MPSGGRTGQAVCACRGELARPAFVAGNNRGGRPVAEAGAALGACATTWARAARRSRAPPRGVRPPVGESLWPYRSHAPTFPNMRQGGFIIIGGGTVSTTG